MALSYQAIYDIIYPQPTTPGLNAIQHPIVRQILIAMTKVADGITTEDPATANHTARAAWASMTLQNPQVSVQKFLLAAMHTAAVQAVPDLKAVPDASVLAVVTAMVDRLA